MDFSINSFLYKLLIDPLLSGLREGIIELVSPCSNVIDVACGTGALSIRISLKAEHVTGIDNSPEMIAAARRNALRKGIRNAAFQLLDASDMSQFGDRMFDMAVTSMAVHQFNPETALTILSEMKRIAPIILIADYNHHMPSGWGSATAWGIERLAGGEHYRNFRNFMLKGGIHWFARVSDLHIRREVTRGGGVFVISECIKK
ncbi:MAG: class I SAM-dependent methyltransferase [Bacteroidales bacterium]|nr:class I SAM-dependent methyltransferase [Bacteroidales bacterium]